MEFATDNVRVARIIAAMELAKASRETSGDAPEKAAQAFTTVYRAILKATAG